MHRRRVGGVTTQDGHQIWRRYRPVDKRDRPIWIWRSGAKKTDRPLTPPNNDPPASPRSLARLNFEGSRCTHGLGAKRGHAPGDRRRRAVGLIAGRRRLSCRVLPARPFNFFCANKFSTTVRHAEVHRQVRRWFLAPKAGNRKELTMRNVPSLAAVMLAMIMASRSFMTLCPRRFARPPVIPFQRNHPMTCRQRPRPRRRSVAR